ncbi:hypothetical protein Acr_29g0006740 [Actinidia rufa]|uniref:Uncharacterized protein n=1 Tax=Actinidia rufa TaxID=165716 RepID=A0A7J0HEP2_9ERIC|nr:hypothetical protein Acr_29g0006740 [Actinidia rufa]
MFNRPIQRTNSNRSSIIAAFSLATLSTLTVEKVDKNGKLIQVIDCKENEEADWLPPPPKVSNDTREFGENSSIKELRLKKPELASFAKSADELLRSVEQTTKIGFNTSLQSTIESAADQSTKPLCERAK